MQSTKEEDFLLNDIKGEIQLINTFPSVLEDEFLPEVSLNDLEL